MTYTLLGLPPRPGIDSRSRHQPYNDDSSYGKEEWFQKQEQEIQAMWVKTVCYSIIFDYEYGIEIQLSEIQLSPCNIPRRL